MRCLSIGTSSRLWVNFPNPPALTIPAKFMSDSARLKLSALTTIGVCPAAVAETSARATTIALLNAVSLEKESTERFRPLWFAFRLFQPLYFGPISKSFQTLEAQRSGKKLRCPGQLRKRWRPDNPPL